MPWKLRKNLCFWSRGSPRHYAGCRHLSSVVEHEPTKIRNMALVAHIDSGKTTLTESILHTSHFITSPGTVDTGSTTTDFLPAERERGITIQSASIPVKWKHWTFNLIDTPGHADFGMEVESASRVVDGAVVLIDSVEGVESQTKGVWKQLDRYSVPTRILFLNKLDRPGASFRSSLVSLLSNRLHRHPMALTLPVASFDPADYKRAEPGMQGIVDLVKWEIWKWEDDGTFKRHLLPRTYEEYEKNVVLPPCHPMHALLVPARTALLENLSMFSDELMESLLALPPNQSSYLSISSEEILSTLRSLTLRKEILPVLCGSAMKHIGTELVLDYAGHLLANPEDVNRVAVATDTTVQILAWKVSWHKRKGWMTFVRIYSGTLTRHANLLNTTRNQRERVSKLLLLYASQHEEVEFLAFGSVGVILGLKHTRTGDTLVSTQGSASSGSVYTALRDITPPPPVMSASIIAQSSSDLQPVQEALVALARTDPSVRLESTEGQLLMHGLGALHLEIVEGRLRDEWGVQFQTGPRRVSYREGFGGDAMDFTSEWTADYHGKPIVVTMDLTVRALADDEAGDPVWDGNVVLNKDGQPLGAPGSYPDRRSPWAHVAEGLAGTLTNSPLTSLPISRMCVSVRDFNYPAESTPSVLAGASSVILRKLLNNVGMGPIMEPYVRLKVDVTEQYFGKVIKDITENGGEVLDLASQAALVVDEVDAIPFSHDGVYIPPDWLSPSATPTSSATATQRLKRSIHAQAPLSKMLDFSSRLRAMSGGHGTFEMMNVGFKAVADARKMEILKEIGRA